MRFKPVLKHRVLKSDWSMDQQIRGLALHRCGKGQEKSKGMLNRFIAFCFKDNPWSPSPTAQLLLTMLISSFLERKNICNKGKWNIPFISAHCVLICCLECHRGNIQDPFIFSPVTYVFLTIHSLYTQPSWTQTLLQPQLDMFCYKQTTIHLVFFINKMDKERTKDLYISWYWILSKLFGEHEWLQVWWQCSSVYVSEHQEFGRRSRQAKAPHMCFGQKDVHAHHEVYIQSIEPVTPTSYGLQRLPEHEQQMWPIPVAQRGYCACEDHHCNVDGRWEA